MNTDVVIRTLCLCVVLAGVETLHGIARTVWAVPRIGKARAQRYSIVTGSALAAAVCWALVPGIGLRSVGAHAALGVALAAFMASFDIGMGHWLLRRSWGKALEDLDPRQGNLLLFGLAWLALVPMAVFALRSRG